MAIIKINIGGVIIEMEKEKVSEALEAGEIKLETDKLIPKNDDHVIYTKANFETFKTNLADEEYKKGKKAGGEMIIKDGREKHGLEFEGKTLDNFAEAYKAKVLKEAEIEPDKKIKELEEDLGKVRKNFEDKTEEFNTYKTGVSEREARTKKDNKLLSFMPSTGLIVSEDIALMAIKSKLGLDVDFSEEGKSMIVKNGQHQKDGSTLEELEYTSDFMVDQLKSINLIEKPDGGSGKEDDKGGGGAGSYEKFVKEMKDNDINEGSEKFSEEMNKRIKDKTLVM